MNRYQEIEKNLHAVQKRISEAAFKSNRDIDEIKLIAVTKNFPVSDIQFLAELGVHDFGENRDSEASQKAAIVEATWHFQGQIQSNKLKSICSWAHVIHSLDELRHYELIEKFTVHPLQIFLQVNLDSAKNRGGAEIEELFPIADAVMRSKVHTLSGLMAVAPLGADAESSFIRLQSIHSEFLEVFPTATSLSSGMSGDFESAISHGATHVRIGSQILGSR